MSRRKQSNPKPLKPGPSDEESEDSEGREITAAYNKTKIELPPDILELQHCDEEGREVAVCGAIRLPRGSSLGPYEGEIIIDTDNIDDTMGPILEFSDLNGKMYFIQMGSGGRWLSLLKRKDKASANCNIYIDGEKVWCEIRRDILIHSELTAAFSTEPEELHDSSEEELIPAASNTIQRSESVHRSSEASSENISGHENPSPVASPSVRKPIPEEPQANIHPLVFPCPFCSVRFSSPRTLEAHVHFYCSKKPEEQPQASACQPHDSHIPGGVDETCRPHHSHSPRGVDETCHNTHNRDTSRKGITDEFRSPDRSKSNLSPVSPQHELERSNMDKEVLNCPDCSYTCRSSYSLNRHRNDIHKFRISNDNDNDNVESTTSARDMFCYDCNIQFSSMSTYRGHKDYYCPQKSSRRSSTPQSSPNGRIRSTDNASSPNFVANPIPLKDSTIYSALGGIVVPTQLLSQSIPISMGNQPALLLAAPVIASGSLTNITMPAIIMQPLVQHHLDTSPNGRKPSPKRSEISPRTEKRSNSVCESQNENNEFPLDLSTKSVPSKEGLQTKRERSKAEGSSKKICCNDKTSDIANKRDSSSWENPTRNPHFSRSCSSNSPSPRLANDNSSAAPGSLNESHLLSPSRFLMYDRLGTPFINKQLIPNPAFIYGMPQHHSEAELNSVSPNVSKCMDCNIVFFKRENFLIHRKHYCASRKRNAPSHSDDGSISSRSSELSTDLAESSVKCQRNSHQNHTQTNGTHTGGKDEKTIDSSPSQTRNNLNRESETHPIYFCTSCCIKFSSADTLQAHKEFYCSELKLNVTTERLSQRAISNSENTANDSERCSPSPPKYSCPDCLNSYPSSRLLKLHFCGSPQSKSSLLRCLYCEFVAQTENKYIEHMKAHAPSKVYRCALCGYRGNTIRGMRMHGKMHADQGTEFTDEHMLEFEEPPQIPTSHRNGTSVGHVDIEAELIRMKNEPYKRRRSRKSFEKSEYCPTPRKQGRHVCPICYEIYPDTSKLSDHMHMHVSEAKYTCRSCNFSTDSKSALIKHMTSSHEEPIVKREIPEEVTGVNSPENDSEDINVDRVTPKDISFDRVTPKIEVDSEPGEETSDHSEKRSRVSTPRSSPDIRVAKEKKIKRSPSEEIEDIDCSKHAEKENVPVPFPVRVKSHSRTSPVNCAELPLPPGQEQLGPKYCQFCDINFTFISSFLAHKQYYCSGGYVRVGESDSLSNTSLTRQEH